MYGLLGVDNVARGFIRYSPMSLTFGTDSFEMEAIDARRN